MRLRVGWPSIAALYLVLWVCFSTALGDTISEVTSNGQRKLYDNVIAVMEPRSGNHEVRGQVSYLVFEGGKFFRASYVQGERFFVRIPPVAERRYMTNKWRKTGFTAEIEDFKLKKTRVSNCYVQFVAPAGMRLVDPRKQPPPHDQLILKGAPNTTYASFGDIKRVDFVPSPENAKGSTLAAVITTRDGKTITAPLAVENRELVRQLGGQDPDAGKLVLQVGGLDTDAVKLATWYAPEIRSLTFLEWPADPQKLPIALPSELRRGVKVVVVTTSALYVNGVLRTATIGERFEVAVDVVTAGGVSVFIRAMNGATVVGTIPADVLALDPAESVGRATRP